MLQITIKEIWKPIVNYEGLYEISNYGRIKSFYKYKGTSERILESTKNKNGYIKVALYKNHGAKQHYIHRLVLETFIGPCPKNMEVCHGDGSRDNNFIGNLRYDTYSNNDLDKRRHGTTTNPVWINNKGIKNNQAKLNDNKIIEIRHLIRKGVSIKEIAIQYSVDSQTILNIKNKESWRHVK